MAGTFLQQLQAQPWYASVAQVFANANVPAPLWQATIEVEDPSLNPNATNYNPSTGDDSHGLFQINLFGSLAGDPARLSAAYGSPETQAAWAAAKMQSALAGVSPNAPLSTQLQAIERSAWPGNLSEDAKRQAALADVTGQPAQSGGFQVPGTNVTIDPIGNPINDVAGAINNFTAQADAWIFNATAGALFLALVAGGFAILAAGNSTVRGDIGKAALAA